MPRGRKPLPFAETRRSEIFREICAYADKHNTLPCRGVIYSQLLQPKFGISKTACQIHFDRLLDEGYLVVDHKTGAVSISQSKLFLYVN